MTPDDRTRDTTEPGLPQGRHESMVVEAEWVVDSAGTPALALSLAITAGESRGTVVDARFAAGSPALEAALEACGAEPSQEPGDPEVCSAVLAMPCTLVVVHDPARGTGLALTPP